ncbi:thiamine pyrophosphate-dependent enzyme [Paraburkholderia sp. DHOC27]|uniref:thiamine pyrophosphate-dependent enzyme n=1 Tax=Paraburkholderia sp. DHOC27 TaxID=2303330 RepID=UPI000E3C62EF|nr:thiamine pyrophosphate-dependent enzyme [Paraburkholderia sp. DHOC27]RFU47603.1 thiamine pyrophosphate-binding protein [Paraburkholderia sp. DHOC27]
MNTARKSAASASTEVPVEPRQDAPLEDAATAEVRERARAIARAGGLMNAIAAGTLNASLEVSVSEALVLALLRQHVSKYLGILGHGTTDLGNILRIYTQQGATHFFQCRNEVAMTHAATVLAWVFGETPAVVTSIGPGALQAFAGSLAAASNGVGVYHIYGDETTHGEGYNMQQIPGHRQNQFLRLTETMGGAYTLHTPQALRDAMRRGTETVHRPYFAGPFFLMLPINVQPRRVQLRIDALPERMLMPVLAPARNDAYDAACELIERHARIVIKAGGGARRYGAELARLAEAAGAVVVLSPNALGVLPDAHPRNMHVGGSKGSLSGNHAMENATLLIAVGSRAVCQADCSGTGYPLAEAVVNINGDIDDANHYNHTVALTGDIGAVIEGLLLALQRRGQQKDRETQNWLDTCVARKLEWHALKHARVNGVTLMDDAWGREVLTQPSAIHTAAAFAKRIDAIKLFDAGDVQANGFQIVEDDRPDDTFTESGASYMGFAASGLLASALARHSRYMIAFSGDGSFMMNPQILIDAVVHGVKGMLVLFDNRRMGAISSLQVAQYGPDFGTQDDVQIDFVAMANAVRGVKGVFGGWTAAELEAALDEAHRHDGLSVVHVPVYWGAADEGGMGAYGRWNVGPWVADVEQRYGDQTL